MSILEKYSFVCVQSGCHHITTYDFVVNRRHDRTVNETLSQFNQLTGNNQHESRRSLPRIIFQRVRTILNENFEQEIFFIIF